MPINLVLFIASFFMNCVKWNGRDVLNQNDILMLNSDMALMYDLNLDAAHFNTPGIQTSQDCRDNSINPEREAVVHSFLINQNTFLQKFSEAFVLMRSAVGNGQTGTFSEASGTS